MAVDYSANTCTRLADRFDNLSLARPMRVERYDIGQELTYETTGVWPSRPARVRLVVDKFAGGGFAGQVYRVKVLDILPGSWAVIIPPSVGSSSVMLTHLTIHPITAIEH